MHKMFFILTLLFVPLSVFAANMDVTADTPSGTYHTPVYITLTPTEVGAKTFYSFKPDGYPGDAFLYTGAILLKHSSPFIYFSFTSTSNESKIKQNDYIIEYPEAIRFETESISGSGKVEVILINSGSESVNIGFWYVQSESDMVVIPEGTMVAPGEKYGVRLNYAGVSSIVLRSPDDDEKDILVPRGFPEKNGIILPKKRSVITKMVPRKIISIAETPSETAQPVPTTVNGSPVVSSPWLSIQEPTSSLTSSVPTETANIPASSIPDINRIMKASTAESGQKNMNPLYLVVLFVFSAGVGGFQWLSRRKQK